MSFIRTKFNVSRNKGYRPYENLIPMINQTGILQRYSHISTIVGSAIQTLTKCLAIKAKWKLQKDAASSFEKILEAASNKTAAVQPLNLTNHPSMTCWALLGK